MTVSQSDVDKVMAAFGAEPIKYRPNQDAADTGTRAEETPASAPRRSSQGAAPVAPSASKDERILPGAGGRVREIFPLLWRAIPVVGDLKIGATRRPGDEVSDRQEAGSVAGRVQATPTPSRSDEPPTAANAVPHVIAENAAPSAAGSRQPPVSRLPPAAETAPLEQPRGPAEAPRSQVVAEAAKPLPPLRSHADLIRPSRRGRPRPPPPRPMVSRPPPRRRRRPSLFWTNLPRPRSPCPRRRPRGLCLRRRPWPPIRRGRLRLRPIRRLHRARRRVTRPTTRLRECRRHRHPIRSSRALRAGPMADIRPPMHRLIRRRLPATRPPMLRPIHTAIHRNSRRQWRRTPTGVPMRRAMRQAIRQDTGRPRPTRSQCRSRRADARFRPGRAFDGAAGTAGRRAAAGQSVGYLCGPPPRARHRPRGGDAAMRFQSCARISVWGRPCP